MFVRTESDTIINLAAFQAIKIVCQEHRSNVCYLISAESKGTITEEFSLGVTSNAVTSVTLATFGEDKEKAEDAYNALFTALLNGETAFDMQKFSVIAPVIDPRKEIERKIAELRINPAGSRGMPWWKIRKKLGLKYNQLNRFSRDDDHFKESMVERIESFEGGWEYNGILEVLLGFEPEGELLNRIEACKPKPARLGALHVKINGQVIWHRYASDTFVETIETIGIERLIRDGGNIPVYDGTPLVSLSDGAGYKPTRSGDYYIMVGTSTQRKVELLEQTAARFDDVELIAKKLSNKKV